MRTTHRAAAILLLAFALAGCGPAGGPGGATTPGPGGTAGLGTVGTDATPTGGTSNSAPPATYPSSAGPYTQAAVNAWVNGDTARLDQLRDPATTIFATLSAGDYDKHFAVRSCQGAAGSSYCVFYNNVGDELTLKVSNEKLGHPHALNDGQFSPITFPTNMQSYAQECLDAWKAGNTARVSFLTTADAKTHLYNIADSYRSTTWTFVDSQGAAGSSYLTWRDGTGDRIVFRFHNPGVDPNEGPQHRIVDVLWNP
jgi:hypothetical protein